MKEIRTHDTITRQHDVKMGSDKSFGIVFSIVFGLIGVFPLLHGDAIRLWPLIIAVAFLSAAFVKSELLKPLNIIWFKFGLLLHKVVNPLVMGLVFIIAVVPTGLIMKLIGKNMLQLKKDTTRSSYWIIREPPGPAPEDFKRQF